MLYREGTLKSADGVELITYRWNVESKPKGTVFLHHGLHAHTFFDYMETGPQYRDQYEGSIVEMLNKLGLVVCAHDVRGHGRSAGDRAVLEFEKVFNDAEAYIDSVIGDSPELKGLPIFLGGNSMGGLIAVQLGIRRDQYAGLLLFSAALKENENVGIPGQKIAEFFAEQLVVMIPRLPLVKIPPCPDETIRAQFKADPLTWKSRTVVKTSWEFLKAFRALELPKLHAPLIMFYGSKDHVVSVNAARDSFDLIPSTDKRIQFVDTMWHDVLHEEGFEDVRETIRTWVAERL